MWISQQLKMSVLCIILFSTYCCSCDDNIGTGRNENQSNEVNLLMKGGSSVDGGTSDSEVVGTEMAGTEMAGTEMAGTEMAGTEMAGIETAGAEVSGIESSTDMNMAGMDFVQTDMGLCEPLTQGVDETCDGMDDDCDGNYDEDFLPPRMMWSLCDYEDACDQDARQYATQVSCVDGRVNEEFLSRECERDTSRVTINQGVFGDCGNFESVCSENGTRTRTDTICRDGAQVSVLLEEDCMRIIRDTVIEQGEFGECTDFESTCDETGQRTRVDTICQDGFPASVLVREPCTRRTDGIICREGVCASGECI